jgi:hypothetical protein
MTTTPAPLPPPNDLFVMLDPNIPACLQVSRVLDADLWGAKDGSPSLTDRIIVVVERPSAARQIADSVREGGFRPALVVGWNLPEDEVAGLLDLKVPVVDGSVLEDPTAALEALNQGWASERFSTEATLARELEELEQHVDLEGRSPNGPMVRAEV